MEFEEAGCDYPGQHLEPGAIADLRFTPDRPQNWIVAPFSVSMGNYSS